MNEDTKFKQIKKYIFGHIIIEKISDDLNLLTQFEMIVESLSHFSYIQ